VSPLRLHKEFGNEKVGRVRSVIFDVGVVLFADCGAKDREGA
jgi:hypothetical protein